MLDADLAEIYGYEVKRLNEQVKNNKTRFPEDFMFQLHKEEIPENFLKSKFSTLKRSDEKRGMHIKKLPYAFTEQGIYMLATVLRGELAEQQSIFIMRTFREMRHYIRQNQQFVTQAEKSIYVVDDYMNAKTLQLLSQKKQGVRDKQVRKQRYDTSGYG